MKLKKAALAAVLLLLGFAMAQDGKIDLIKFQESTVTGRIDGTFASAVQDCALPDGTAAKCQVTIAGFPAFDTGGSADGSSDNQLLDSYSGDGTLGSAIFYARSASGSILVKTEFTTGAVSASLRFAYGDGNWTALIVSGADCWTESAAQSDEWHYDASASCAAISQPAEVFQDESDSPYTLSATGSLGSLAAGQCAWGDNDLLGADTLYCYRLGEDPDAAAGLQVIASNMAWTLSEAYTATNSAIGCDAVPCLESSTSAWEHGEGFEIFPKGADWARVYLVSLTATETMSLWMGREAETVR